MRTESSTGADGGAEPVALGRAAKHFRVLHTVIAVVDLAALSYIWTCAIRRRRDSLLRVSTIALVIEGVALVIGRGKCPLGPLQRKLGDSVPLFEVVLPPRAAKAAVPVLAAISVAGVALAAVRPPAPSDTRARPSRGSAS